MTTRGPLPEDRMPLLHVQWGPTAKKYDLDMTKLTPFYTGATINDKAVQNGLAPYLKITNQAVMRAIGDNLLESQYSTHNYAIYAKLIWFSLVRDLYTQTAAAPVLQPFPDGFDPMFVNLGDAQLHPAAVTNPIRNGNIILVEGYDWSLADLQALMLQYSTMAGDVKTSESEPGDKCKSCKSTVQTGVKCISCKWMFHSSCALRVSGLKVLSGSKSIVQCSCASTQDDRQGERLSSRNQISEATNRRNYR